jgi:hypothetical protein
MPEQAEEASHVLFEHCRKHTATQRVSLNDWQQIHPQVERVAPRRRAKNWVEKDQRRSVECFLATCGRASSIDPKLPTTR